MHVQRQTISVEEALRRLLADLTPLPEEQVGIGEAYGRTLAQNLAATCDMPPFDRSPLDGFAVRAADTAGATPDQPVRLRVLETVGAGQVPRQTVTAGTAVRIMTGAMIPPGADAVIMFEQTEQPGRQLEWVGVKRALRTGENISRRGKKSLPARAWPGRERGSTRGSWPCWRRLATRRFRSSADHASD
ncbi:hypothetical protein [Brevibacillus aydinogluensis]|uniref:Molybdopterin molybdenumtransferase n=1 Tax=Brevibacillus aydinogluensis TaxID=927786 RepID=A0AA48M9K6_9BACL|nr:hypothetical protein [Brevibacillus aydinogluensis]CAJ1003799.1 hypothetical protein BSPP4475_15865 [Brevibacillus aydinogluensis]